MQRRPLEQLDRMFDQLTERVEEERVELGGEIGTVAVDVAEWDGECVVVADLPGFEPEDIDLRVVDRELRISAEHKGEHEPEVETYHRRERAHRSVSRSVQLPGDIEPEAGSASYENGVLSVTLPKARETEREGQRIEID